VAVTAPDAFVEELWQVARGLWMPDHPWFKGIVEHRWTREQIILGEIQHYLRVRTNPIFFVTSSPTSRASGTTTSWTW